MRTLDTLTGYFRAYKKQDLFPILEIIAIVVWAVWVGRAMLDFDENKVLWGGEYSMSVSTHHFWTFVEKCGWCATWDGSQIGGYPAFANTYAPILHPVTMITTLLLGVVNGSKIIVLASLIIAGIAQWWLAHELGVGRLARLWGATLVIVGGHLAGKMEIGLVGIVLSLAVCSFVYPAVLMVARRQDWRSVVVLALVVASGVLSGQGYVQITLMLTLPAFAFLLMNHEWKLTPLWKKYAAAAGLAILMSSVLAVPVLVNSWNIHKYSDPYFSTVQPLKYGLLNFVIDDFEYFQTEVLGKPGIPSLYINFIGWSAPILAIFAVGASKEHDRRKILYLAGSATIILCFLDGDFLKWVAEGVPFVASVRFPTLALGIAVPPIIGLASYGLDQILTRFEWPFIGLGFGRQNHTRTLLVPLSLIILIPLAINIHEAYSIGRIYFNVKPLATGTSEKLEALKTESSEWIQPVYGEDFWKEPAVRMGLKLTNESLPFWVGTKNYPEPFYQLSRDPLPNPENELLLVEDDQSEILYLNPDAEYAIVVDGLGNRTACSATATGGRIDVSCNTPTSGRLVVHENRWAGWSVWIDGERGALKNSGEWLVTEAPAGEHTFALRYRPWDVPLGLALTALGLFLCGWLWFRKQNSLLATDE